MLRTKYHEEECQAWFMTNEPTTGLTQTTIAISNITFKQYMFDR